MSEEKAKEIIARNLRIWRTRKHFRNFLKKDPELTKARLRSNALRDLIGTEKTYVDALTVLVKVYLEPLKTTKKKLLPPNDVKVIFSNGKKQGSKHTVVSVGWSNSTILLTI
eukprot:GEZU01022736.1.p1 GENE.GEZU01022736.1~~GEZU01022736.1.p1  ORF type:complete len:112 (+),score=11.82 GEZU01022736.1:3-338(+)